MRFLCLLAEFLLAIEIRDEQETAQCITPSPFPHLHTQRKEKTQDLTHLDGHPCEAEAKKYCPTMTGQRTDSVFICLNRHRSVCERAHGPDTQQCNIYSRECEREWDKWARYRKCESIVIGYNKILNYSSYMSNRGGVFEIAPECSSYDCNPGATPVDLDIFARTHKVLPQHDVAIKSRLGLWGKGSISKDLINDPEYRSAFHFKIIDNRLYTRMQSSGSDFMVEKWARLLLAVLQEIKIPDVDFILFPYDQPVAQKHEPMPLFSVVTTPFHNDIMLPNVGSDWEFAMILSSGYTPAPVDREMYQKKHSRLIWRGAANGFSYSWHNFRHAPRMKLIKMSRENPRLIDAAASLEYADIRMDTLEFYKEFLTELYPPNASSIAMVTSIPEARDLWRSIAKPLVIDENKQGQLWKAQINIDGAGCSNRYMLQLSMASVVLKVTSPFLQWYYEDYGLEAWVHYVPVRYDLTDLPEKVEWVLSHEREVLAMIDRAQVFVQRLFNREDFYYYIGKMLAKFSELLAYKPQLEPAYSEVRINASWAMGYKADRNANECIKEAA